MSYGLWWQKEKQEKIGYNGVTLPGSRRKCCIIAKGKAQSYISKDCLRAVFWWMAKSYALRYNEGITNFKEATAE